MWRVCRIDEADYGCEERMPGEPLMVLVTIENEDGRECTFQCSDEWLIKNGIDEGDEWPEDVDASLVGLDTEDGRIDNMNNWMNAYYDALDELEEEI